MWASVKAAAAPFPEGQVLRVVGLSVDVAGLSCAVGDVLSVAHHGTEHGLLEVVAVADAVARCMPLTPITGLKQGLAVRSTGGPLQVPSGPGLLGRVLDGLGRPMDGLGPLAQTSWAPFGTGIPHALTRRRVSDTMSVGVRTLDTLTTMGKGQRMGLFAGSGVGKSTLLSMVARGTEAPVSVIALVGERGREVREFLEDDLGSQGLARSVVVVATSDQPALARKQAAFVATAIAQGFRDSGTDVLLMMDSLTRVAMAQREIGLSVGEPPATRGYPPSTFAVLADLLERAGGGEHGSVTGIYTVLVDGDDHNEPIADAARSILDGHVVLARKLAVRGHYPAIDALGSISRVASKVLASQERTDATALRAYLAAKAQVADLLEVGAYVKGTNPLADAAIALAPQIDGFLRQATSEHTTMAEAFAQLHRLVGQLDQISGGQR
ncbi:FliI/YscN family ATPase [Jonesiaceae bacterium BS-20]|uniref:FliI/YscN family ATPase n=1 Tax=Jonesiaceae bacterium BS-20 TaxID=3120821 RepID=A0AAU7DY89_9MICO